jgi:hypothetical protein
VLYFAYGSNMNWEQMKTRCPSARFVAVALLPDYKLAFTRKSINRGCGVADGVLLDGDERRPLTVFTYFAERQSGPPRPNAEYKALIIAGARYWNLPDDYVATLENIEVAN